MLSRELQPAEASSRNVFGPQQALCALRRPVGLFGPRRWEGSSCSYALPVHCILYVLGRENAVKIVFVL